MATEPAYPRLFDPAELGRSLKEVATDIIRDGDHQIISRWFHSVKDADLFIWTDKSQNILKQQLTFYGQVVEWNLLEGVKTGLVIEDEGRAPIKASELVRFDSVAQSAPVGQAVLLLAHVDDLAAEERARLVKNFSDNPTAADLSPEAFVAKFGGFAERSVHRSWLRRLFDWFLASLRRQS